METQIKNTNSNQKFSISFFFLSLGVLIGLVTSVVSFLGLFFETLNKRFPDVLNANYQYGNLYYDYDSMRASLATLIIFFPVFLLVHYFWDKKIKKGLGEIDQIVRKWLIYLVLFLSSLVIVIDLVTLVRYFVSGEITDRFIYKVAITLLVALFIGFYYIFEIFNKKKIYGMPVGVGAAIKSSIFVILVIYFAFVVMGSPKTQRLARLDDIKINDLQTIQYQIINYWQQKEKLPSSLEELVNPISSFYLPVSPEIDKGITYEYKILDEKKLSFSLCTTFNLPIQKGWVENNYREVIPLGTKDIAVSSYPNYGGVNESWDHEAGYKCFDRTIDKDLYPPFEK